MTIVSGGWGRWPRIRALAGRLSAIVAWFTRRNDLRGMSRAEFEQEAERGSLYVGSPETVARKIAATVKLLGAARFDLKYTSGALPHELAMRSIELYGREVMPRVKAQLALVG